MKVKNALYSYCLNYVEQRLSRTREEINAAQSSANEETKSSVGDKYETSRAMAQLEVERSMVQLKEAEKLRSALLSLVISRVSDVVIPGSHVTTSKADFYIAISLGLVTLDQRKYFIVSQDSPIGKLLMGRRVGDTVVWNNQDYIIQAIV